MVDVIIREATETDVAAVMALYVAAGLDSVDGFTAEEAREHLRQFRRYPSYRLFVALDRDLVVGTYALMLMDNLAKRGRKLGVAEEVGVLPGHQGRGIGRAMMQHAMEQCRVAGCYKLMLSSNVKRQEAHRFYESLSFEQHGWSFVVE